MNLLFGFGKAFVLASLALWQSSCATYPKNTLLMTKEMENKAYENRAVLVLGEPKDGKHNEPVYPVRAWLGVSRGFKDVLIKKRKLYQLKGRDPQKKTLEEILKDVKAGKALGSFHKESLSVDIKEELNAIHEAIVKLGQPQDLFEPEIEHKLQLIGASIYLQYGHHAMVYVCERDRKYLRTIEKVWDGVGRWLG